VIVITSGDAGSDLPDARLDHPLPVAV